jgi:hypothetical protein
MQNMANICAHPRHLWLNLAFLRRLCVPVPACPEPSPAGASPQNKKIPAEQTQFQNAFNNHSMNNLTPVFDIGFVQKQTQFSPP